MFRKLLLSCAALLAATACSPLAARPLVDMAIVDRDGGQWLPQYRHGGDAWVPGVPGHHYAVRLTNTSGERVLVVLSVDGVNAVSGEDADPAQGGYVLEPWESAEVAGWRKSLDDIAQFYFTDLPDSYAARTGRPGNVGVIGIAVFREARLLRVDAPRITGGYEAETDARAEADARASAPAAGKAIAQQRIGTGHGAREWSPVDETRFERASSTPIQITQLRYEAPQRLVALGIVPHPVSPHWPQPERPQAFPGGFVADPPRRD